MELFEEKGLIVLLFYRCFIGCDGLECGVSGSQIFIKKCAMLRKHVDVFYAEAGVEFWASA